MLRRVKGNRLRTGIARPSDVDASAYFARLSTPPSPSMQASYTEFVLRTKAAGIYQKCIDLTIFAIGANLTDRGLNAITNARNLTATGTVNQTVNRGVYGDGSTGYFSGQGAPNTWPQIGLDSLCFGGFVVRQGNGLAMLGRTGAADQIYGDPGPISPSGAVNSATGDTWSGITTNSIGATSFNRRSGGTAQCWRYGTSLGDKARTSSSLSTFPVLFGRRANSYFADTYAMRWTLQGLTDPEMIEWHAAALAFVTKAFGWVPIPPVVATTEPLLSSTTLPDVPSSTPGKGFGCTGLARDSVDGTWWVGNHVPPVSSGLSSIVHLSADRTTVLAEYKLADYFVAGQVPDPTNFSVQGVVFDDLDNTVYLLCKQTVGSGSYILHIGRDGSFIAVIGLSVLGTTANGLTIDTVQRQFVISGTTGVYWADMATAVQTGNALALANAPDQLWFDGASNRLLYSHDQPNGLIGVVDLDNEYGFPIETDALSMVGQNQLEGFVPYNGIVYSCRDAWTHPTTPAFNQMCTASAAPLGL